ncbi:hematopoietic cell signal transducer precursor [Cricetulus griseus]|uniref:Hematopoietic cell signal transducer n=1 Tax=Cricetulus griseus TaxID=10029 RepID=A0A061HVA9_CRIGR|nr:hematopoietic cell signal transducer precursor [Cricetulus griseus]
MPLIPAREAEAGSPISQVSSTSPSPAPHPAPVLGTSPPTPIHLLCLSTVAAGQTPAGSCSGCGPLSLPLLAGLVAADAVLSLLIVGVVFVCMRPHSRPAQEDSRVYINMPGRG